jgi:hypothetical protein
MATIRDELGHRCFEAGNDGVPPSMEDGPDEAL